MTTALVVIDLQCGFDDPSWGLRNNLACEENVAALVRAWRERGDPVVFVRHDSVDPDSPLYRGSPGNAFKDVLSGSPDLLVTKCVHSAFLGDQDLGGWLRERTIDGIAVCGIQTEKCCETTARMGGNLGFDVRYVLDATHTFDKPALDGSTIAADELARVTAANLHEEFATVVSTRELVG